MSFPSFGILSINGRQCLSHLIVTDPEALKLPSWTKVNSFLSVVPFLKRLKAWLSTADCLDGKAATAKHSLFCRPNWNQLLNTHPYFVMFSISRIQKNIFTAFQQMGYRFSQTFVQNLLAKYDPRTRRLTLDNFIVACVQIQRLTSSFRTRDREMKGQATMAYEDFIGLALGAHNWKKAFSWINSLFLLLKIWRESDVF